MRLTREEIILVTFILLALTVGSVVKHYRDQARRAQPLPTPAGIRED